MSWLNYHHLHYFWVVAREGGLGPASKVLRLARPTLSGQIRTLEASLGTPLFAREGRRLALTEVGRVVLRYADEIFTLGREMVQTVEAGTVSAKRIDVGITDVMTKLVVARILAPVLALAPEVHLVCHEESHARLLTRLAAHELDVIIADAPVPAGSAVRAYNHLLGECGVSFFGSRAYAPLKRGFPRSLEGAPMLAPIHGAPLRRALDEWLAVQQLTPRIVVESEDSALLKVFGSDGVGVFVAPRIVEREIAEQYDVVVLGRVDEVRDRFYAISAERRLKHPAVEAIFRAAKSALAPQEPRKPRARRASRREATASIAVSGRSARPARRSPSRRTRPRRSRSR